MKFLLISDSHLGNPTPGYHHQSVLPEPEPLFQALAEFVSENQIDFIFHAGDIIDDGSPEQFSGAVALLKKLPCPVYATPGNHDLMHKNSIQWMVENMPDQFPEGKADYFLIRDGIRFNFLTTNWCSIPAFWDGTHLDSCFHPEQLRLLDDGPQDLPGILITHSPVCGLPTAQTGFPRIFHAPPSGFEQQISELTKKKNIRLILGGHNHLNLAVKKENYYAVTVSALREMPFEFKLFELNGTHLKMQTCSLDQCSGIHLPYDFNKTHVQGRGCDRVLEIRL